MKRIVTLALALALLVGLLTGCGKAPGKAAKDAAYNPETDYPYSMFTLTTSRPIAETEKGYYFYMPSFLFYMDKTSMEPVVVCGKPNCLHYEEATEEAFQACSGYFDTMGMSRLGMYNGDLYIIAQEERELTTGTVRETVLERVSPDGSRRQSVLDLGQDPGIEKMLIHRGKLYLSIRTIAEDGRELSGIYAYALDNLGKEPETVFETEKRELGNTLSGLTAYGNCLYFCRTVSDEGETELCIYDIGTKTMTAVPATEDGYAPMWVTFQNGKMLVEAKHFLPVGDDPKLPEAYPKRLYRANPDGSGMEAVFDGQGSWTADDRYIYRAPNLGTEDSTLRIYDAEMNEVGSVDLYDFLENPRPGVLSVYVSQDDQVMISHFVPPRTDFYWFDKNDIGTGDIRLQTFFRYDTQSYSNFNGARPAATTAAATKAVTTTAAATTTAATTAPVDLSTGSIEVEDLGIDLGGATLEFMEHEIGAGVNEARVQIWERLSGHINGVYNGNVTLRFLPYWDYYETLRIRIDTGTAPDVLSLTSTPENGCSFQQLMTEGALVPLDDYVPTLLARSYARVDERYYGGARWEGRLYGIIRSGQNHPYTAVHYNKERTDAAGVEIGPWIRLSDLWDEAYALRAWIDENEPEKYDTPVSAIFVNWLIDGNFAFLYSNIDCLGMMYPGYEAVAGHEAETEVFNIYDCPEFVAYVKSLNQMVTDRILPQERNKLAERGTWVGDDDAYAGKTVVLWWQRDVEEPAVIPDASGKPKMTWTLARPAVTLDDGFTPSYIMHAVSRDCKDPEAACGLIEILNNDLYVGTTLMLGEEGKDWTLAEDGRAQCKMGHSSDVFSWGRFCDINNCLLPTNHPADIFDLMREADEKMVFTDDLGFSCDPVRVMSELEAVEAVSQAYLSAEGLYSGHQTPAEIDAMAAEFIEALNAAGIDRIREEYQRQLDAWRAGR